MTFNKNNLKITPYKNNPNGKEDHIVNTNKIIRIILLIVLGLILLIALVTGANILFFWSIFAWIQSTIHSTTGLDVPLTKGLAALIMAAVVMFPLGKLFMAFMPIPQKNKGWYRAAIFIGIAVFFLFLYFGGQNTYFDPQTGKPLKYYSISPIGTYKFFSAPGFDPETGDALKPVTRDIILKSKGVKPRVMPKIIYSPPPPPPKPKPAPETSEVIEPEAVAPPPPKQESYRLRAPSRPRSKAHNHLEESQVAPNIPYRRVARNTPPIKSYDSRENWGSLKFDNKSNMNIVVITPERMKVLTISPRQLLTARMAPGKYFYTPDGGSSYHPFWITERRTNYQIFESITRTTIIQNQPTVLRHRQPVYRPPLPQAPRPRVYRHRY